jgi:tight adherence protein C
MLFQTILVFGAVFAISEVFLTRYWTHPGTLIDRVMDRNGRVDAGPRVPRLTWTQVVLFAGALSKGGRGREQLQRDFVSAGISSPRAETIFHGLRVIGAFAGAALMSAVAIARGAEFPAIVFAAAAGAGAGFMLPSELLRVRIRRRRRKIEKALPNALDLMTIGVEAGLGLDQAILHVSTVLSRAHPEISEEFARISAETRAGKKRADALRSLAERTGILEMKKLAAVLIQADRFGTSIASSLRAHSEHLRVLARQTAEEKAAKLGVKMVFPIFFFILPSLFILTVGPIVVRIFKELLPMMNSL